MSKVIWHISMSLDGFIAGPNDSNDPNGPNDPFSCAILRPVFRLKLV